MNTLIRALRRREVRYLASAPIVAALLALNLGHGSGGTAVPVPTEGQLDAYVEAQLHDAGIPGAGLAVVRDGQVVHVAGFGVADDHGRPVTADTPFAIGSISKSITALAVMQLVEAGRVELDAPVVRYLPEFRLADPADSARITVRQLLDQTSGISTAAGRDALHVPVSTLELQVRGLANVAPASAPGSAYAYSNLNYAVLGLLVERVSGEPFGRYVAAHVFEPLGMTRTFTDVSPAEAAGLSRAHRFWFGVPVSEAAAYRSDLVPAGYVLSSARDMGRYLAAQLGAVEQGGGRVLSVPGLAAMHAGVAPTSLADNRYGMGWFQGTMDGLPVVWHDGSTGDMSSIAIMVPSLDLGLVLLANAQSPLYELLMKTESIGFAATDLLAGRAPGGTLELLYPAFDLLLAIALVLQLRGVVRAFRRVPGDPRAVRGIRRWLGTVVAVLVNGAWPVLVLVEVPAFLGAPWPVLVQTDIGLALLVLSLLRASIGGIRLARWLAPSPAARLRVPSLENSVG